MIDYEDNFRLLFRIRGSIVPKAILFSTPAVITALILSHLDEWAPDARKDSGMMDITESQLWNACTAVIAILLGFRTRQAMGRFWEGTSLLHQMRGEWFDAASCLVSFSRDALSKNKYVEVWEFRHTLIRLMSLMHGSALDEISDNQEDKYEVLDIHGLDTTTLRFLRDCKEDYDFNRVEALQHMIQVLVTHNHHSGVLTIPPPILSRVYQTLSRGLVNLLNAKKIKDTMFPFPYAQIIFILLVVHTFFTPLMMTQVVKNKVWSALLSFFPIFGMYCINFIAVELEMPFGSDENDLPLRNFQTEMNATLLMLIHEKTDHLPHTSVTAVSSFDHLAHFARATLVRRDGHQESHSKSYMAANFFDDDMVMTKNNSGNTDNSSAKPSRAFASTGLPLSLEPKREEKEAEAKLEETQYIPKREEKQVAAKLEEKPSAVEPRPLEEKAPSANLESQLLLPELQSLIKAEESPRSSGRRPCATAVMPMQTTSAPLPAPVVRGPITVPTLGPLVARPASMSELMRTCCAPDVSMHMSPRQQELIYTHGTTMALHDRTASRLMLPPDVAHFGEHWLRKTEVQIEELKSNTDSIKAFSSSFPKALSQHTQVLMSFTEAVLRTLDTVHTLRGNSLGIPSHTLEQSLLPPTSVSQHAVRAGAGFPAV
mmetsp:Transcript_82243/g.129476  ORF Transcript_82243/g.129476 Transcript_82243/m.129476 type:complete len:656 (+) Transcript_82243:82-2049(+)